MRERKETKFLHEPVHCPKFNKVGKVVQRIIVAPWFNYCCRGNRTMLSAYTVNMHVTHNNIKISTVAEQCFYSKFMSPTT